ncbi:penicillin-binding protein 1A [Parapedomonas caeni]
MAAADDDDDNRLTADPEARRRWRRLGLWLGGLALFGMVIAGAGYAYLARGLPDVAQLQAYEPALPTTVLAADGTVLTVFQRERRIWTPYDQIPETVRHAFISAEDKTFYEHSGLDYPGILRAILTNIKNRGTDKRPVGASTITQQLSQAMLLGRELSYIRKLREMILARRVEAAMSKQRILELYLNQIFLGRNSYGIGAASLSYFDKTLDQLTLDQAAFLAALPKGPSLYSSQKRKAQAIERRNYVLEQMLLNGYVTRAQHDLAVAQDLRFAPIKALKRSRLGDYFVEEVRRELLDRYGEDGLYGGGLWVYATIDPSLQKAAEKAMRDGFLAYERGRDWRGPYAHIDPGEGWHRRLNALDVPVGYAEWQAAVVLAKQGSTSRLGFVDGSTGVMPAHRAERRKGGKAAWQLLKPGDVIPVMKAYDGSGEYALRQIPLISGGFVALDPESGRVLAMVGGFDARKSQFNRATQALRQPGSAFKPFVYAAALDNGFTPSSVVIDGDFCVDQGARLGTKCFRNFGGRATGAQTLRTGLEMSRNLMTVRLANAVGMEKVADVAVRLGIRDTMSPVLAMSLGAGETTVMRLTNAYGIMANGGHEMRPTLIDRIQDRHGKTIFRSDERACPACAAVEWQGEGMPRPVETRRQVMDPRTAYQVIHMLEGVIDRGTATNLRFLERPMAGKTGTTNNSTDVWFVGMTPHLVAGLYVGYDQPTPLGGYAQGGTVAAPIWGAFARVALKDMPKQQFRAPEGLRFVKVDRKTGKLAQGPEGGSVIWEAFRPGTEPRRYVMLAEGQLVRSDADFAETTGGIY